MINESNNYYNALRHPLGDAFKCPPNKEPSVRQLAKETFCEKCVREY